MRVLFICKQNETYGVFTYGQRNSGLYNSTHFIAQALKERGIHAHIAVVVDNNSIDREVSRFKPDLVIIEALWVVPEKFDILQALHPSVSWFCHLHSNIPFLAMEGVAVSWLKGYAARDVGIITNSEEAQAGVRVIIPEGDIFCLTNIYGDKMAHPKSARDHSHIDIGCFGAIRPMKNQLIQAVAALQFAREKGKHLRFHINGMRVEQGDNVLRNLKALFADNAEAELICHPWYEPDILMSFLSKHIDIGMQVSLTETFNVVTADYVAAGLPVVVSPEVSWVSRFSQAGADDVNEIVLTLGRVWGNRLLTRWNQRLLRNYSRVSLSQWLCFLN